MTEDPVAPVAGEEEMLEQVSAAACDQAARALSAFLGLTVLLVSPREGEAGRSSGENVEVRLDLTGRVPGVLLLRWRREDVHALLCHLSRFWRGSPAAAPAQGETWSSLLEVANITASSYLSFFSVHLECSLIPSVPLLQVTPRLEQFPVEGGPVLTHRLRDPQGLCDAEFIFRPSPTFVALLSRTLRGEEESNQGIV